MVHIEKREAVWSKTSKSLVDLVRCEDCAFWKQGQWSDGICEFHSTKDRELVCTPDDFCSGGKRKEQV